MDYMELAGLIFPGITDSPEDIEAKYLPRNLPEGAKVTRFAPSPTGFMHLGNLFGAMVDDRLAHQSGGAFYLRIEDTDLKRAVPGGVEKILAAFSDFEIPFDEGAIADGDNGEYGPYRQRQRVGIYQVFAKWLISQGKAYPCFCTEDELSAMREKQVAEKLNFGYYGEYAAHRNASIEDIRRDLDAGKPFVIRYRSEGDPARRIKVTDLVRGTLEIPENDQDVVLLKSDGVPTYHFAHVVDDHLMRTTHVVRGEEWLATLAIHVQLFVAMGWKLPKYIHTSTVMKMDGGSKRKLSKRKDPELALDYYKEKGYSVRAVKEYILTLLNSNYEEWRLANPDEPLEKFAFNPKKMSVSGALFDLDKLSDISRNVLSKMTADGVYEKLTVWARDYDGEFYELLTRDPDYARGILSIGRGGSKPRKDIAVWSEAKAYMSFFYDELFEGAYEYPEHIEESEIKSILSAYLNGFTLPEDGTAWFDSVKELASSLGYAANMKDYKADPSAFKGSVGDVSTVIRVAVTGRQNSPDLYEIMKLLGEDRVKARLEKALA